MIAERDHFARTGDEAVPVLDVMGMPMWALDRTELIDLLVDRAVRGVPSRVCYVNARSWNLARRDASFRQALFTADVLYADGMSLVWASRILGSPLPDRLSSADYAEDFAAACARRNVSLYLLGGAEDVACRAAETLTRSVPGLRIAGSHSGYFGNGDNDRVVDEINRARPDMLLVGMGSPLQEQWGVRNRSELDVPVLWSVGALFDYLAGTERRAPQWMCRHGLEWAFRLSVDPVGKARRYLLGNPMFVGSVIKARFQQALQGKPAEASEVSVR